jgi:hypothetical protein
MATRMTRSQATAWKRRAIARMTRSRAATLRLLARLPDEALLRPRTQGAWSIKDVLAHIAAWEAEGAERMRLVTRGRADRVHFFDDMAEADRYNARAVAAARGVSLPVMLGRLARARAALVTALRALPAEALRDPSHRYPVVTWLPEFAWTHEEGHAAEIRAWSRLNPRAGRTPRRPPSAERRRPRATSAARRRAGRSSRAGS